MTCNQCCEKSRSGYGNMNTIDGNRSDFMRRANPPLTPPRRGTANDDCANHEVQFPSLGGVRGGFVRFVLGVGALCFQLSSLAADNPLTPDQALASFKLEPGLRAELVAAEPLVGDPVAIAWDECGRMFVAEN